MDPIPPDGRLSRRLFFRDPPRRNGRTRDSRSATPSCLALRVQRKAEQARQPTLAPRWLEPMRPRPKRSECAIRTQRSFNLLYLQEAEIMD